MKADERLDEFMFMLSLKESPEHIARQMGVQLKSIERMWYRTKKERPPWVQQRMKSLNS